jgi:outer membrane protein
MRKSILLGAAAYVALMVGAPAQGLAQSMEEVLATTYRTNPQLSADRARLRAIDEGVPRALSNWRPVVSLSAQAGKGRDRLRTDTDGTTTSSDRLRTPEVASLSVQQPLYRGGRTLAETSRAENLVLQGRAQLQSTEQSVLLDAATAHTNLLQDQAVLDLNVNNEQVLQRQLDAARDRFQVGEITRTDVSQAEARLSRARADRIQSEGNLTSTRANYLRIVGELPTRLSPARVPAVLPTTEADALAAAAAENPAVVAAQYAERASRDDVDLVAGEFLPTLSLQGTLSRQHETQTRGLERDVAEVTAVLSVPLYQAGSVDARVREAKQTASQRRILVEDTLRRAREDATRTWEALTTARARIQAFQAQIRANEIALEGVEQEARVGSRTVLDVLDAEQELLDAKVNLVRAQRDEIVSGFQLAAATGRLTAQNLKLPVEVYDPTLYYGRTRERWIGTDVGEDEARAGR